MFGGSYVSGRTALPAGHTGGPLLCQRFYLIRRAVNVERKAAFSLTTQQNGYLLRFVYFGINVLAFQKGY
jgi:hypothetical protein